MSILKPRATSVVIYQGDDLEEIAHRARQVKVVTQQAAVRNARWGDDDAEVQAAQAAYDAFVEEAAARAAVVTIHALNKTRFRELMAANPAREDNEDDAAYGVNVETFSTPFLRESIAKVELEDRSLSPSEIHELIDELPEGDWEKTFSAAYYLNRLPGADPREGRFSSAPLSSAETSN